MSLFTDTFNRSNSGTVGNDWTEVESVASNFQIITNTLFLQGSLGNATSTVMHRAAAQKSGIKITWTMSWDDDTSLGADQIIWVVTNNDTNYGKGVGVRFLRDSATTMDIYLVDDSTTKGSSLNFAIADGTTYNCELSIASNYAMEFRCWQSTRPSSATVSCAAFTPTTNGTKWAIMRTQSNQRNAYMDTFSIDSITNTAQAIWF